MQADKHTTVSLTLAEADDSQLGIEGAPAQIGNVLESPPASIGQQNGSSPVSISAPQELHHLLGTKDVASSRLAFLWVGCSHRIKFDKSSASSFLEGDT